MPELPKQPILLEREWDPSATEWLVCAEPDDYRLALVIKRTYSVTPDGRCVLADQQEPLEAEFPLYDDLAPPRIAPPSWDSDLIAFKQATDIVLQGHAYGDGKSTSVDTELAFGNRKCVVRVHGDRRCEWDGKQLRFTPAKLFEQIPLRYDRAYGGFDALALAQHGDPVADMLGDIEPDWGLDTCTDFHYPRNRAGCGYLMQASREATETLVVPNLEFPFDPITPERLAVGDYRRWPSAPLPAAFDWCDLGGFPRLAYLGEVAEYDESTMPPAEVRYGWAPPELLNLPSIMELGMHPGFLQGASPGLAVPGIAPNQAFLLRNLWPGYPERRVELPGWLPRVTIHITATDSRETETHLNAIVFQPDRERLILVWSAHCQVGREYIPQELAEMTWNIV